MPRQVNKKANGSRLHCNEEDGGCGCLFGREELFWEMGRGKKKGQARAVGVCDYYSCYLGGRQVGGNSKAKLLAGPRSQSSIKCLVPPKLPQYP
jgi:hypothetical protein